MDPYRDPAEHQESNGLLLVRLLTPQKFSPLKISLKIVHNRSIPSLDISRIVPHCPYPAVQDFLDLLYVFVDLCVRVCGRLQVAALMSTAAPAQLLLLCD